MKEIFYLPFFNLNIEKSFFKQANISKYDVNYVFPTSWENSFDNEYHTKIIHDSTPYMLSLIVCYFAVIFATKQFMENRNPFDLKFPLFVWNSAWAIFSLVLTFRAWTELLYMWNNYGLSSAICLSKFDKIQKNPMFGFWAYMFTISKIGELGDTLFLILRKRKLTFLHCYHHATVLFYTWISFNGFPSTGRMFISMNGFVHLLMYTYFAVTSLKIRVPRPFAMFITCCQISQMIFGTSFNLWAYFVKTSGNTCDVSYYNIKLSFLIYFSYVVLFSRFFYESYFSKFGKNFKNTIESNGKKVD